MGSTGRLAGEEAYEDAGRDEGTADDAGSKEEAGCEEEGEAAQPANNTTATKTEKTTANFVRIQSSQKYAWLALQQAMQRFSL